MNLQHLEYFITIAKTKNFTTASNILLVTQPALSKAISKLEEELEVPLFKKSGRNIELTRFGEVFLTHAQLAIKYSKCCRFIFILLVINFINL